VSERERERNEQLIIKTAKKKKKKEKRDINQSYFVSFKKYLNM
jgi:hypothetical protein